MAPVPLEPAISYSSVGLVASHALAVVVLTVGVTRSLYRSYRALGPSQDTRERQAQRSNLMPVFAILALISLGTASYSSSQHAILSYKTWASERDIQVPARFYGDEGFWPFEENSTRVHLGRWVTDTPFYLDGFEILAEKARRFWWGQQLELGLIPWNLFLAIEGRRRNIPLLWCYAILGQVVSLSFGQNLFFLALLLTPSPLPPNAAGSLPVSRYIRIRDAIFTPKPSSWAPHGAFYHLILWINYALMWMTTRVVNTPDLKNVVIASRLLALAPLALPYILPASAGTTHSSPHDTYQRYKTLFKTISLWSFALHGLTTVQGLARSAPSAYYHRHSVHLPFDYEKRTSWERTTHALGRMLAATSDHPVVRGASWDVMMSGVSLGLWAAVRSTSVSDILASSMPGYHRDEVSDKSRLTDVSSGDRRRASAGSIRDGTSSTRKRGRGRKSAKNDTDQVESEASYEPTPSEAASVAEGDELLRRGELDWESAALIWGLTALGGLGAGTAGVLGGECIAR